MEEKQCKACLKIKPIESFHKCKNVKSGRDGKCKQCKLLKIPIKTQASYNKKNPHQQEWDDIFRITNPTKQDYKLMFDFLERIGYERNDEIHLQFCEKHGLKPRVRKWNARNFWLSDGSVNEKSSTHKRHLHSSKS